MIEMNQERVLAWCAEVRALRSVYGRPITSPDDPRVDALCELPDAERSGYRERAGDPAIAEALGTRYFDRCFDGIPSLPIDMPSWATEVRFLWGNWPEVAIELSGAATSVGSVSVKRLDTIEVMVDEWWNPMGGGIPAGSVRQGEPTFAIDSDLTGERWEIPASIAQDARAALAVAVAEASDQ